MWGHLSFISVRRGGLVVEFFNGAHFKVKVSPWLTSISFVRLEVTSRYEYRGLTIDTNIHYIVCGPNTGTVTIVVFTVNN